MANEKSVAAARVRDENLESRLTRVQGLSFHYRVSTDPGDADLPAVVLVHGLGVSSRYMLRLARRLAPRVRVYAPDLPGFGRSEKPGRVLSIRGLADALSEWMDQTGLASSALLANSIGCQVVVELALRRPELAESIILVSPTVDRRARTVPAQFFRLLLDVPREPVSLGFVALFDYLTAGLGRIAETFGYAMQDRVEEKLPRVRQPALVVRGGRDPLVSMHWAEEVSALLPSGRLVVIPNAGHAVNYNSPEQLARAALDFLTAHNY